MLVYVDRRMKHHPRTVTMRPRRRNSMSWQRSSAPRWLTWYSTCDTCSRTILTAESSFSLRWNFEFSAISFRMGQRYSKHKNDQFTHLFTYENHRYTVNVKYILLFIAVKFFSCSLVSKICRILVWLCKIVGYTVGDDNKIVQFTISNQSSISFMT